MFTLRFQFQVCLTLIGITHMSQTKITVMMMMRIWKMNCYIILLLGSETNMTGVKLQVSAWIVCFDFWIIRNSNIIFYNLSDYSKTNGKPAHNLSEAVSTKPIMYDVFSFYKFFFKNVEWKILAITFEYELLLINRKHWRMQKN